MSQEGEITRQVRPVLARDGAKPKLMGLMMSEWAIILVTLALVMLLKLGFTVGSMVLVAMYLFLKTWRRKLPDNFIWRFVSFWYRKQYHYHASAADTLAKPYLVDE